MKEATMNQTEAQVRTALSNRIAVLSTDQLRMAINLTVAEEAKGPLSSERKLIFELMQAEYWFRDAVRILGEDAAIEALYAPLADVLELRRAAYRTPSNAIVAYEAILSARAMRGEAIPADC